MAGRTQVWSTASAKRSASDVPSPALTENPYSPKSHPLGTTNIQRFINLL